MNNLDYLTFITVVLRGRIRGNDLFRLCNSSKKFNEYCNRSFQSINNKGEALKIPQDQYLFRLLLREINFQVSLWKSPRQTYLERTKGGTIGILKCKLPENCSMNCSQLEDLRNIIEVNIVDNFYLFLDTHGQVWTFGKSYINISDEYGWKPIKIPTMIPNLQNIVQISSGHSHTFCLDNNGKIWCFGFNNVGQLGLNDISIKSSVAIINENLKDIVQVSAGGGNSCCLDTKGKVWCMGNNNQGQLGLGYMSEIVYENGIKVPIMNPYLNNIIQVSVGDKHCLCLDDQGNVWSFGSNHDGQLGSGDKVDSSIPLIISNLYKIVQVSAGDDHSLCLDNRGRVWCFGSSMRGELGLSRRCYRQFIPVFNQTLKNIVQVNAGYHISLCLDIEGNVWAFGDNKNKRLDVNDETEIISIPKMLPNLKNVIQIAPGNKHTLFIKT
jgi:alpha-tubulin suppressor-like RCC1 family protein